MKNYRISYENGDRDKILDIISNYSNDVLINNIKDHSVGITIEADNAEDVYIKLLKEVSERTQAHVEQHHAHEV